MKFAHIHIMSLLTFVLVLSSQVAYSQKENVRIISRCDAEIVVDGGNILYRGIDNTVSINIEGIDPENIFTSLSPRFAGTLEKVSPGRYKVLFSENKFDRIKVNVSQKVDDGKVMSKGAKEFRVLDLPTPVISLNRNSGSSINKDVLASIQHVTAEYEDFGWKAECEVAEYDYIYSPKRGQLMRGSSKSVMIPEDLQNTFKNAMPGDMLIISHIKVKSPNGDIKPVWGSLIYTVE